MKTFYTILSTCLLFFISFFVLAAESTPVSASATTSTSMGPAVPVNMEGIVRSYPSTTINTPVVWPEPERRQRAGLPAGVTHYATKIELRATSGTPARRPQSRSAPIINNAGLVLDRDSLWLEGRWTKLILPRNIRALRGYGLNDLGQVVGTAHYKVGDDNEETHAFLRRNNRFIDLGTLSGRRGWRFSSEARSVNNKGEVVGASNDRGDRWQHAFLWKNGRMTRLPELPDYETHGAVSINDVGQVVGVAIDINDTRNSRAVIWENGGIEDLGGLSGGESYRAVDINNQGQVVGSYARCDLERRHCPRHIFLWENGMMRDLGVQAVATDINNKGQIVGYYGQCAAASRIKCGVLAQNGRSFILNDLLPEGEEIEDWREVRINDSGQIIVGNYLLELPEELKL